MARCACRERPTRGPWPGPLSPARIADFRHGGPKAISQQCRNELAVRRTQPAAYLKIFGAAGPARAVTDREPRRSAISNGIRSSSTRAACMSAGPRTTPSVDPIRGDEICALRKLRRENPTEAYVFVTERGGPMSTIGFHHLIQRLGKAARMPFPLHPHMLRHASAISLPMMGTIPEPCRLSRPQEHPAHRPIHRAFTRQVPGLLARLAEIGLGRRHLGSEVARAGASQTSEDVRADATPR